MLGTKLLTLPAVAFLAAISTGVTERFAAMAPANSGAPAATRTARVQTTYFTNANTAGAPDGTVQLINPGSALDRDVCANIYVFYPDEEIAECCSCFVTPDSLFTLSINNDLTANPLTDTPVTSGVIKIVGGTGTCNPTFITPTAAPSLAAWGTHILSPTTGGYAITETEFASSGLSAGEQTALQSQCSDIVSSSSFGGICSCNNEASGG